MAEIKYRKHDDLYVVERDGKAIGTVYRSVAPVEWIADTGRFGEIAAFGRRKSAAEWLVRQAESFPGRTVLPRTEGRGGAK